MCIRESFNISGFYNPMISFLKHSVQEGFIRESFYETLIVTDNPLSLLEQMDNYFPKNLERWVKQ